MSSHIYSPSLYSYLLAKTHAWMQKKENKLAQHFFWIIKNRWGQFLCIMRKYYRFMAEDVLSCIIICLQKDIDYNVLIYQFIEDVTSWIRGTHAFHENWAPLHLINPQYIKTWCSNYRSSSSHSVFVFGIHNFVYPVWI